MAFFKHWVSVRFKNAHVSKTCVQIFENSEMREPLTCRSFCLKRWPVGVACRPSQECLKWHLYQAGGSDIFWTSVGCIPGFGAENKSALFEDFLLISWVLRVWGRFQNLRQTPVHTKLRLKRFPSGVAILVTCWQKSFGIARTRDTNRPQNMPRLR